MVKFTDGNWLVKEGYKISSPMVLHDFIVVKISWNYMFLPGI